MLRKFGDAVVRGDDPAKWTWVLPKKPYQFVAACAELAQALDKGPDFITRLPLTFDATCSGLQHFCAMTRASEGRHVNLVSATDEPQDLYKFVAFQVSQLVHPFMLDPIDYEIMIGDEFCCQGPFKYLEENPFKREIVKQPTMSYFYGSEAGGFSKGPDGRWRPWGMTKQLLKVLKDVRDAAIDDKKTDEAEKLSALISVAGKLAKVAYTVIKDTVPGAAEVREWSKGLAKLCADENKMLRWPSALGLPVINCYHPPVIKKIKVYINGRTPSVNLVVGEREAVWKRKVANSAPANLVHSVDAALLQLVAVAAKKEGIDLATVHDCFGCLASRAERLNEILCEQFVHLHKDHNVLAKVWSSARKILRHEPPKPPKPGDLEIEDVIKSKNLFR